MTVQEVMSEIEKDEIFYHRSGGGVTISGGEPVFQGSFVTSLLKACKLKGYHTTLDTSGYGPWPIFEKLIEHDGHGGVVPARESFAAGLSFSPTVGIDKFLPEI